jgi:hypothetical protein
MSDTIPKEPKKRIIEVERRIAAQLFDIWIDMKLRILQTMETRIEQNTHRDPSVPSNTASVHNHS